VPLPHLSKTTTRSKKQKYKQIAPDFYAQSAAQLGAIYAINEDKDPVKAGVS
jgi:hypothetical protein